MAHEGGEGAGSTPKTASRVEGAEVKESGDWLSEEVPMLMVEVLVPLE